MKKGGFVALILAGGLVGLLFRSPAIAQCPEGKTEVLMTLKTGKTIMICISEQGAQGLENAGDKSPGIVFATCPCFTEEAVAQLNESEGVYCKGSEGDVDCEVGDEGKYDFCSTVLRCVEGRPCSWGLEATDTPSCVDVSGATSGGTPIAYFDDLKNVGWVDFCAEENVTCVEGMTLAEAEACMNILKQYIVCGE